MNDFAYSCEISVRKIFQCDRFEDPLGKLSNADNWIYEVNKFDVDFQCVHGGNF